VFAANYFRCGLIVFGVVLLLGCAATCGPSVALAAVEPTAPHDKVSAENGVAEEIGEPARAAGPEEWQTDLAIWTFVVFVVLLAVLTKFAWGPIVAGLQKREQGIADNIAAAQRSHDEAKLYLAEYEKKLANAANEVRMMLDEARRDAEHAKQEIIAEAKAAAQAEQQRGVREVRLATDQALKELSERSTNLAVELAGKIVQAQLKPADHSRLVQEAMTKFTTNGPSAN
jgi:F-type H+-transporting ATPase subunit b